MFLSEIRIFVQTKIMEKVIREIINAHASILNSVGELMKMQDSNQRIMELEKERDNLLSEMNGMGCEIAKLRNSIKSLELVKKDSSKTNRLLKSIEQLRVENERLSDTVAKLREKEANYNAVLTQNRSLIEELDDARKELNSARLLNAKEMSDEICHLISENNKYREQLGLPKI